MCTHLTSFSPSRRGARNHFRLFPATTLFFIFGMLAVLTAAPALAQPGEAKADASTDEALVCHYGLCSGIPQTMIVYNGDLIVGGSFLTADDMPVGGIARWDGSAWRALGEGTDGTVHALAIYDGKLIAGGKFAVAGGYPANGLAVWDGSTWASFGSNLAYCETWDLCIHDGRVIAAGDFRFAAGDSSTGVIASDGGAWTALGNYPGSFVQEIHAYDGTLVAAEGPSNSKGFSVAAWNGTDWTKLGTPFSQRVMALTTYNGVLVAGGGFILGNDRARLAAWNGATWQPLGAGPNSSILDLEIVSGDLVATGFFTAVGSEPMNYVARWDGVSWQAIGAGVADIGLDVAVYGNQPVVCGAFATAENPAVQGIAVWDGMNWSGLSTYPQSAFAFRMPTYSPAGFGSRGITGVYKADGTEDMYGFDFFISADASVLTFTEAFPGTLFDDSGQYQWEYFQWRIDSSSATESRIRVVGIADLNNGPDHPLRTNVPDETEMFALQFNAAPQGEDTVAVSPIRFQWRDCGDNTVALNAVRDTLALSRSVYHWSDTTYHDLTDTNAAFPTMFGAPHLCFDSVSGPAGTRFVDFYNGLVTVTVIDTIDWRGDLNVNGIAYEIADWVMFINYFFQGESVFPNPPLCILATDVNCDGLTLRLEDLVFLERIICGDTIPVYQKSSRVYALDSAVITQDIATRTVSVDNADTLAGLFLVFQGEIVPTFLVDTSVFMAWAEFDGSVTRVMILPVLETDCCIIGFVSGPLFTYTGDGLLIEKEYAEYPGIYEYPQAADYQNDLFHHNPIRILGTDGRVELWPAPLSTTLARINDNEVVLVYLGNFNGHTVSDIDTADLRLNDTLAPLETTIFASYEGFEGPVMRALFDARDFILLLDTLMVSGTHVFAVSGSFTDEQTFVTMGLTTLAAEKAYIPVPGGWPTIQAGIDASIDGDVVQVFPGTYTGDGNRDLEFGGRHITLTAVGDPGEYVEIVCAGMPWEYHRFIDFHGTEDSTTIVDGFSIDAGMAGYGGAILITAPSSPTIQRCEIWENIALADGGAISVFGSSPIIRNCQFYTNYVQSDSGRGGAISAFQAAPTIQDCLFHGNKSWLTGGAVNLVGLPADTFPTPVLRNCRFYGNYARGGGGLNCELVNPVVDSCVFDSNGVNEEGGGLRILNASPTLSRCLMSKNWAGTEGGGLWLSGSGAMLSNCTIAKNAADTGTGIFVTASSSPYIDKSIISANDAGGAFIMDETSSVLFTCTDMAENYDGEWVGAIEPQRWINGNMSIDPLFCDPIWGNYHLHGLSACLPFNNDCDALVGAYGMACGYICGETNGDSVCNIGDAVYLITYIFRDGPPPTSMIGADVNMDGNVDLGDAVAIVNYIFRGQGLLNCMIMK